MVLRAHPYLFTGLALLILSGVSIFIGVGQLSLTALWRDPAALQLLWLSRIPRTLAALLVGSSIAVAGVIMQLLVRNRFVEPGTTGTSEAAMLGLLAVTILRRAGRSWPR